MMEPIEAEIARALWCCTFRPASWDKRFARDVAFAAENPDAQFTERQRWWLHRMAVRYRRQMPPPLVDAAKAWLADHPDEPPKLKRPSKRKNGHDTRSADRPAAHQAMLIAIAVIAVLSAAVPAAAQMVCGDRDQIIRALESEHKERKDRTGITGNGGLAELFVSDTESWTLLMTLPGGPACLLGSGDNWGPAVPKERRPETRMH